MGASRTSFEKLQRDRAKKAKAAAKREKRLERSTGEEEDGTTTTVPDPSTLTPGQEIPPDTLLRMVAELHEQFEAEKISFEEFEERKTELFALIAVE